MDSNAVHINNPPQGQLSLTQENFSEDTVTTKAEHIKILGHRKGGTDGKNQYKHLEAHVSPP